MFQLFQSPVLRRQTAKTDDHNTEWLDKEGIIDTVIEQGQKWRVEGIGSIWFARYAGFGHIKFMEGEAVRIVGIQGNTLLIEEKRNGHNLVYDRN